MRFDLFTTTMASKAEALVFWSACLRSSGHTGHVAEPAGRNRRAGDAPHRRSHRIPFMMVRELPIVEGTVNGIPGKFLLDTDAREALPLNHHRIPMKGVKPIGSGYIGCGQVYEMLLNAQVGPVAPRPSALSEGDERHQAGSHAT